MLYVVMLSAVVLNVVMLSVVMSYIATCEESYEPFKRVNYERSKV